MKQIVFVVALAGCLPATPDSSGCPFMADGRKQWRGDDGRCNDQPPLPAKVYRIEPAKRDHVVEEEKAVDGVIVRSQPVGAAAWTITIENTTDGPMSALWDESSFVIAGQAQGRLLRGETRKIDTGKAQPPDPIPSHASIAQTVFAEKLLKLEEDEEKLQGMDLPMTAIEARKLRAKRNGLLVGGKLHVTIDVSGVKKTWTGVVKSTPTPTPSERSD